MLITEHVRSRLSRQLSNAYSNEFGVISLVPLSAEWEQNFAQSIIGEGEEKQLATDNVASIYNKGSQCFGRISPQR